MKLIVIYGFPGVGKLTTAEIVAEKTGYKLFHNHLAVDIAASLYEFGTPEFIDMREKIWNLVIEDAETKDCEGIILTLVFEKTVTQEFIDFIVNYPDIQFFELACDQNVLKERVSSETRKRYSKITDFDRVSKLISNGTFYSPEIKNKVVIDNSDLSPDEAAGKIISELN